MPMFEIEVRKKPVKKDPNALPTSTYKNEENINNDENDKEAEQNASNQIESA